MEIEKCLTDYLKGITGESFKLVKLGSRECSGMPLLYYNSYDFIKWEWLGKAIILAIAKDENDLSPSEYAKHAQFLKEHLGKDIAMVLPSIDSYKRNRLIRYGVPFIIPGNQLFLPPFVDFRERFPRLLPAGKNKLSAAAQLVLLYHLSGKKADRYSLRELASMLGYSAMTMSNICRELVHFGLCEKGAGAGRERHLKFKEKGKKLWKNAEPLLSNPVAKKTWVKFSGGRKELLKAGMTALSDYTMLGDDRVPCFACGKNAFREMLRSGEFSEEGGDDNADCLVETWKYDPTLLAENDRIDRLSLYLSLKDSVDERVQSALDRLLEEMTW